MGSEMCIRDSDNVSGAFTLSGGTGTTILPSIQFSATAVAVPEPTGFSVCLLLGVLLIGRRGRVTADTLA